MRYVVLALLLVGCSQQVEKLKPYPGVQKSYGMCHVLWDQGADVDVKKCEAKLSNPKFKLGIKVRNSYYDSKACYSIVFGNQRWSARKNEAIYMVKTYCGSKAMHDEFCEKGHWQNCPTALESDLKGMK